jgi:phospholipase D1/2
METSFLFNPKIEAHSCQPIKLKDSANKVTQKLFRFKVLVEVPSFFTWEITRTYSEFIELSQTLHRDLRKGKVLSVPVLPTEIDFKNSSSDSQLSTLAEYLKELSEQRDICDNSAFWEFFEVSLLSFSDSSKKRKEGYVDKRTGGRVGNEQKCFHCTEHCKRLQKRWLIVRDNMVGYLTNHLKGSLHEVLMFKGKFEVLKGERDTGYNDGILILTQNRRFCFRAGSEFKMEEWFNEIKSAKDESEWNQMNYQYESSFPVRMNNYVRCFVDGIYYFNEVCESLLRAKREVFITDWWLSPELYLKRPSTRFENSQVFQVLGTIADRGVSVFVHVYKEVSFALTLNSFHTKTVLQKRNPNIRVIRHPHRSVCGGEFLWTHHEKIVCIDQEIAFIGGLDLCYGRYDTSEHKLKDNQEPFCWNGIDYSNSRIADFADVKMHLKTCLDRNRQPRMPWHDIAVKAVGKVASDVALHFIELWNHVNTDITGNYRKDKIILKPQQVKSENVREKNDDDSDRSLLNPGSSMSSHSSKDVFSTSRRNTSYISRVLTSKPKVIRSGSESKRINVEKLDSHVEEEEPSTSERAIHFENMPEKMKRIFRNSSLGSSVDSEDSIDIFRKSFTQAISPSFIKSKERLEEEEENKLMHDMQADINEGDEAMARNLLMPILKEAGDRGTCECQVVRSAGTWSLGLENPEHSIHTAYLNLIDKADHFIYIENQFFISSTAGSKVKNSIAQALVERIKFAAERKEKFKVIVVLPLLPGFAGAVDDPSASVLRIQLYWLYSTIFRSDNSLFQQLLACPNIADPSEYIMFYGLRTHDMLDEPATEIVYVHSKLMIVDDDIILVGSANINDRSQVGKHDSEIAMVINDHEKVQSILAGKNRMVSKKALELRKTIFKEILGTSDENLLADPVSDGFLNYLKNTAARNSEIYKHVFRCVPDDEVQRFSYFREFSQQARPEDYNKFKNEIRGFLVNFPLHFLYDEDLRITIFNKEFYIPEESFI